MRRNVLAAGAVILAISLAGCAQFGYYAQAVHGQMSLLSQARPIDHWLSDPRVEDDLKSRLNRVREIRRFAVSQLGLPDNGSYKSFADLNRKFVMWNVVATPELSLEPERWCFPVAGCVDYRGYYSKDAAQDFAKGLRARGLDVRVTGVPAYSTLGWFNDPVLSTFIHYPEAEVARLVFHELAHQVAYAPGDSQFNESFATAVEEAGVSRWLDEQGDDETRASYRSFQQKREGFLKLLESYRARLDQTYRGPSTDDQKRAHKAELMAELQIDYSRLKQQWDGYAGYDRWFNEPMSNAHFALISTYHSDVSAFQQLLAEKKTLPAFYQAVQSLARMDSAKRRALLLQYKPATEASTDKVNKLAVALQ